MGWMGGEQVNPAKLLPIRKGERPLVSAATLATMRRLADNKQLPPKVIGIIVAAGIELEKER